MIKTLTKSNLRKGNLIWLTYYSPSSRDTKVSQVRSLKKKPLKNAIYWPDSKLELSFLMTQSPHQPSNGCTHSSQGPPISLRNQENSPTDVISGQSNGENPLIEVLPCRCIKVASKIGHHRCPVYTEDSG